MEKIINLLESYQFTSVHGSSDFEGRKTVVGYRDYVTLTVFQCLSRLACVTNVHFAGNEITVYYE